MRGKRYVFVFLQTSSGKLLHKWRATSGVTIYITWKMLKLFLSNLFSPREQKPRFWYISIWVYGPFDPDPRLAILHPLQPILTKQQILRIRRQVKKDLTPKWSSPSCSKIQYCLLFLNISKFTMIKAVFTYSQGLFQNPFNWTRTNISKKNFAK